MLETVLSWRLVVDALITTCVCVEPQRKGTCKMSNGKSENGLMNEESLNGLTVIDQFSFVNLLKHVVSNYVVEKLFGKDGVKSEVARGIGTTIAAIGFSSSGKESICGDYLVEDYKLPSGSGLLELANVADIWLFSDAVEVGKQVFHKDIRTAIFNSWCNVVANDGQLEIDKSICFTPERLMTELNSIYKLNGQAIPAYMNVKKHHLMWNEVSIVGNLKISDADTMLSKVISMFFGFSNEHLEEFGVPTIPESDRAVATWLFSTSGASSEESKEG